ncbi:MAG: hypothetical protein MUF23_04470 [Pirellula sp.]|jgi:hypothetical protein|nr:hypothetical protein [Pirellula sp.]
MLHTHSSVAAQAARLCAIATTGSWLKPHSGHTNRAPARIDHRGRGVDSTQVSAANRDVWCIVLFWLLVRTRTRTRAQSDRTVLVLDCFAGRSYHSALVDALVRFVFAMGMDEWVSESRLRDEQMRSVHRAADCGADEPIEYEYEYRPLQRTEYEYDGIRWPVGPNAAVQPEAVGKVSIRTRSIRRLAATDCSSKPLGRRGW